MRAVCDSTAAGGGDKNMSLIRIVVTALVFSAIALSPTPVFAQQPSSRAEFIEGRVIDKRTGVALATVEVRLVDSENTMMDLVETDSDGNYRLDLGVLDVDEYQNIKAFFIRVDDKNGRNALYNVGRGMVRRGSIIQYPLIALP